MSNSYTTSDHLLSRVLPRYDAIGRPRQRCFDQKPTACVISDRGARDGAARGRPAELDHLDRPADAADQPQGVRIVQVGDRRERVGGLPAGSRRPARTAAAGSCRRGCRWRPRGVVSRVSPRAHTAEPVGASSTSPSAETNSTSSAPRRAASRIAAMFTAYESVFTPPSSHGASPNASAGYPRSSTATRMPSRALARIVRIAARRPSGNPPVGRPGRGSAPASPRPRRRRSRRRRPSATSSLPRRRVERDLERGGRAGHPCQVPVELGGLAAAVRAGHAAGCPRSSRRRG